MVPGMARKEQLPETDEMVRFGSEHMAYRKQLEVFRERSVYMLLAVQTDGGCCVAGVEQALALQHATVLGAASWHRAVAPQTHTHLLAWNFLLTRCTLRTRTCAHVAGPHSKSATVANGR